MKLKQLRIDLLKLQRDGLLNEDTINMVFNEFESTHHISTSRMLDISTIDDKELANHAKSIEHDQRKDKTL